MDPGLLIVIVVIVVLVGAAGAFLLTRRQRSQKLQEQFGPEYERAVAERGDRRSAEADLADRERHRETFRTRELEPAARERYAAAWRDIQTRFVDTPGAAVQEADVLVTQVMRDRGYPMDKFEQRAADISVDHPEVVEDYRAAHAISLASDAASTEDLREALVHYRALFERLLDERGDHDTKEGTRWDNTKT